METKNSKGGSQNRSKTGETTREEVIREVATLLVLLVRALVDFPHEVAVRPVAGAQAVIFEVGVHPEDVRRIIGKRGRTADAIRELMTSLGGKAEGRYLLEVVEPLR